MPKIDTIRAWKDPEYRESLSASDAAGLPMSPAGPMELRDEDLDLVAGGSTVHSCTTFLPGCPDTAGPACQSIGPSCPYWTDNSSSCQFSC